MENKIQPRGQTVDEMMDEMDRIDDEERSRPEPELEFCGTCNSYPTRWHAGEWFCSRTQNCVKPSDSACFRWSKRAEWKPCPPLYCRRKDRVLMQQVHDGVSAIGVREPKPLQDVPKPRGFVYFVGCMELVKIGYTQDPANRMDGLRTGNPLDLALLGLMRGTPDAERAIHAELHEHRKFREWFHLNDPVRAVIRARSGPRWKSLAKSVGLKEMIGEV